MPACASAAYTSARTNLDKERLRQFGKVGLPKEAFVAALKVIKPGDRLP